MGESVKVDREDIYKFNKSIHMWKKLYILWTRIFNETDNMARPFTKALARDKRERAEFFLR